jgi:hypothetical protein
MPHRGPAVPNLTDRGDEGKLVREAGNVVYLGDWGFRELNL